MDYIARTMKTNQHHMFSEPSYSGLPPPPPSLAPSSSISSQQSPIQLPHPKFATPKVPQLAYPTPPIPSSTFSSTAHAYTTTTWHPERPVTPPSGPRQAMILTPSSSPRSPQKFYDLSNQPQYQRPYEHIGLSNVVDPSLRPPVEYRPIVHRHQVNSESPQVSRKRSFDEFSQVPEATTSHLDILSSLSAASAGASSGSGASSNSARFMDSARTYTVFHPFTLEQIERLISSYGGPVALSRKRRPLVTDFDSQILGPAAAKTPCRGKSRTQGRPFSDEMVIELIMPHSLDNLYELLCVKGTHSQDSVKVRLTAPVDKDEPETLIRPPGVDHDGVLVFNNTLSMFKYFHRDAEQFALVTPIRQSSTQKHTTKRGTCPVVKFNISPVQQYNIEWLKRMAYPRYKANMKIYVVPSSPGATGFTFYTSPVMFLQDQKERLINGYGFDTKSRIFCVEEGDKKVQDLPNSVYDSELNLDPGQRKRTKTGLGYILN